MKKEQDLRAITPQQKLQIEYIKEVVPKLIEKAENADNDEIVISLEILKGYLKVVKEQYKNTIPMGNKNHPGGEQIINQTISVHMPRVLAEYNVEVETFAQWKVRREQGNLKRAIPATEHLLKQSETKISLKEKKRGNDYITYFKEHLNKIEISKKDLDGKAEEQSTLRSRISYMQNELVQLLKKSKSFEKEQSRLNEGIRTLELFLGELKPRIDKVEYDAFSFEIKNAKVMVKNIGSSKVSLDLKIDNQKAAQREIIRLRYRLEPSLREHELIDYSAEVGQTQTSKNVYIETIGKQVWDAVSGQTNAEKQFGAPYESGGAALQTHFGKTENERLELEEAELDNIILAIHTVKASNSPLVDTPTFTEGRDNDVLAVIKKAIGVDHPETENRQSLHQKYDTIYTLLREAKNRDEEVKDTQGEKLEAVTSNIDDLADNTVLGFEETVNKLNALTVELNNVKTLAKELKQKVADAKQELYLSIDGAKSLFRTQDSKTKGALSDMYLHLGEIDGRVIKLITKVSGTTTQVGALRTTVGATNIKVDQLRTEVFNLSNSVDVLKRDFLLFKEKLIEKIAETKKELQAQINELAAKTSNDKEEVLTKVDEAKKEFKDDIDELKTEVLQNRSLSDQRKEQLIARIDKVETDGNDKFDEFASQNFESHQTTNNNLVIGLESLGRGASEGLGLVRKEFNAEIELLKKNQTKILVKQDQLESSITGLQIGLGIGLPIIILLLFANFFKKQVVKLVNDTTAKIKSKIKDKKKPSKKTKK